VLNKWDLIRLRRGERQSARQLIEAARSRIFFLDYAPVLITSASTGENVERLFAIIQKIEHAARKRIGTGVLNRLLRQAFEANPPPLVKGKRLKLYYAAQTTGNAQRSAMEGGAPATPELAHDMQIFPRARRSSLLHVPEFVLFVNDPRLMAETYRRYLEARIRDRESHPGLPVILTVRPRAQKGSAYSRSSNARRK
jgi:GTP-binding protein